MMWMSMWCKCPLMGMSWMRMPACRYAINANARLGMQWMLMPAWVCNECKCLFGSMPWCECPLWVCCECECLLVGMPWCECSYGACHDANVRLGVCHDTKCFGANTIYSKIPFIFKTRLPQRLKPKYFQTQFIIPKKSSSFLLKAP